MFFEKQAPNGKSQLQWVLENIIENPDTKQAVININGIEHEKTDIIKWLVKIRSDYEAISCVLRYGYYGENC